MYIFDDRCTVHGVDTNAYRLNSTWQMMGDETGRRRRSLYLFELLPIMMAGLLETNFCGRPCCFASTITRTSVAVLYS